MRSKIQLFLGLGWVSRTNIFKEKKCDVHFGY